MWTVAVATGARLCLNTIPAFRVGATRCGLPDAKLLPPDQCDIRDLDGALEKLSTLTPRYKKQVLEACGVCISADKEITPEEGELFRGISDVLDCPMPPLLPGQPLA